MEDDSSSTVYSSEGEENEQYRAVLNMKFGDKSHDCLSLRLAEAWKTIVPPCTAADEAVHCTAAKGRTLVKAGVYSSHLIFIL